MRTPCHVNYLSFVLGENSEQSFQFLATQLGEEKLLAFIDRVSVLLRVDIGRDSSKVRGEHSQLDSRTIFLIRR